MSIRTAASVVQAFATISLPRRARIWRELSRRSVMPRALAAGALRPSRTPAVEPDERETGEDEGHGDAAGVDRGLHGTELPEVHERIGVFALIVAADDRVDEVGERIGRPPGRVAF